MVASNPTKIISVFGSSRPRPGSPDYGTAYTLGQLLAETGWTVATGGYGGTMAAVSQGAAEAGGHVIGVTTDVFNEWEGGITNAWVNEEIRYPTLRERLFHLVLRNDGIVALPGGIGTLSEVALAWSFLQTGEMPPKPFILLGALWQNTLEVFYDESAYITQANMRLWTPAHSPQDAVALLEPHWKQSGETP